MSWETCAIISMIVFLIFIPVTVLFFIIKHERKEWARKRSEAVVVEGTVLFSQTFSEDDGSRQTNLEIEESDGKPCDYFIDATRFKNLQMTQRGDKIKILVYKKGFFADVFEFEVTQKAPLIPA